MNYQISGLLAIIAGVIAIITGWVGDTILFAVVFAIVANLAPASAVVLGWVLVIFDFLAALGGVLLISGGIFILAYKISIGKFIISLGVGTSLIGIIASIVFAVIGGVAITHLLGLIAVLISLWGIVFILSFITLIVPINEETE